MADADPRLGAQDLDDELAITVRLRIASLVDRDRLGDDGVFARLLGDVLAVAEQVASRDGVVLSGLEARLPRFTPRSQRGEGAP